MKKFSLLKTLASIKIGVVIILALGTLTAWGTLVEAHFNDAVAAQKMVYNSIWMYGTMAALAICLIAVMIDRWPWQRRHIGFVLAHIGIITIMTGALITRYYGIDGSLYLEQGGKSGFVSTTDTVISTYASMDGAQFRRLGEKRVDFFLNRPSPEKPFEVSLPPGPVKILEYVPYAFRDEKVVETDRISAGAGIRFQLQNPRVSLTEWLVQPSPDRDVAKNLGPAQVIVAPKSPLHIEGRNAIVLIPNQDSGEIEYEVHTAREQSVVRRGHIKAGDSFETGWMGLVFRLLKVLPRAEEKITYVPTGQATPMTNSAIRMSYLGKEYWLGLNGTLKLFNDQAVYVLAYENTRLALDFEVALKEFRVGRYPGTVRAASYESLVSVPDRGDVTISMNEPLKYHGYTFYQASFQEDENHRPFMSILSVNRDPGRWIKYLGSFLIVLGTIYLFYFKRLGQKASKQTN